MQTFEKHHYGPNKEATILVIVCAHAHTCIHTHALLSGVCLPSPGCIGMMRIHSLLGAPQESVDLWDEYSRQSDLVPTSSPRDCSYPMRPVGSHCPGRELGISSLARVGFSLWGSLAGDIACCSKSQAGLGPMPLHGGALKRELRQPRRRRVAGWSLTAKRYQPRSEPKRW